MSMRQRPGMQDRLLRRSREKRMMHGLATALALVHNNNQISFNNNIDPEAFPGMQEDSRRFRRGLPGPLVVVQMLARR